MTISPTSRIGTYARLWADLPGGLLSLLLAFPVAVVAFTVLVTLFATGAGLIVLVIGLPLLVAALYAARGFGTAQLALLRLTGLTPLESPPWPPRDPARSRLSSILLPLRRHRYWLFALHGIVVAPIVTVVTWSITVAWTSVALGGVSYGFWGRLLPPHGSWINRASELLLAGSMPASADAHAVQTVIWFITGTAFLLILPFVVRGLAWVQHLSVRAILVDPVSRGR